MFGDEKAIKMEDDESTDSFDNEYDLHFFPLSVFTNSFQIISEEEEEE